MIVRWQGFLCLHLVAAAPFADPNIWWDNQGLGIEKREALRLSTATSATFEAAGNLDPLCSNPHPDPRFCNAVDDPRDPDDLSWIKKWAAIGDSYAAGIGAGNRIGFWCSRYDGGYPSIINADERFGDPAGRTFTFIACSGDTTVEVIEQAKTLEPEQQMITISAGGNDAGLVDVLNDCIFGFTGAFSSNCDATLAKTKAYLSSDAFSTAVENTILAAKDKLAAGGTIFYTGYAKFFNDETTDCDQVSWHFWLNLFTREYLLATRRKTMNELVDLINQRLNETIAKHSGYAVFINYDPYFVQLEGRYCETGVDENDAADREELLFYQFKTPDSPWGLPTWQNPDKRDTGVGPEVNETIIAPDDPASFNRSQVATFAAQVNDTLKGNPGAQINTAVVSDDIVQYHAQVAPIRKRDLTERGVNLIPDTYGKTFHPQQGGHNIIANAVIEAIITRYGATLGYPAQPWIMNDTEDSCRSSELLILGDDMKVVWFGSVEGDGTKVASS